MLIHGFLDEDDKHAVLGAAAVHVCASDAEGWGQVVIEAAAYGLPTLARDVPGLRASVHDGELVLIKSNPFMRHVLRFFGRALQLCVKAMCRWFRSYAQAREVSWTSTMICS